MAVRTVISACVTAVALGGAACALAADWPQFLGPNRTGASSETGLLTTFPSGGPKVLWKVEGGDGYSGIAVAGGKAFALVQRGGEELLLALDAKSGKEVWKHKLGGAYKNQYGNGPRSTPTVDGGKVYVQSASGPLVCLAADDGKVVWQHDLIKLYGGKNIDWGLSASPLVVDGLVLALPGETGGVAAFDKTTGKLAWHTAKDKAAYASPMVLNVGGKKQIVCFTAVGVLALNPAGKEQWRQEWKTDYDVNIATPLPVGDRLFVSSGENVGCALLAPSAEGKAEVLWESKGPMSVMKNYWATAVLHDKHLYGISGEYKGVTNLNCVEAASGKLAWSKERYGHVNLTLADGHLYILTIDGELVIAEANPKAYTEKARAKVLAAAKYVNAPAIADKKLYAKDGASIICVDIAK